MILDYSNVPRISMWQVLCAKERPLVSRALASRSNTEPNAEKLYIPRELFRDWNETSEDPFPDYKGVEKYAKAAGVWDTLQRPIENDDYECVVTTAPIPLVNETAVEISLKTIFDIVNLALKKTCKSGKQVYIANGKAAISITTTDPKRASDPDRSSFIYGPCHEQKEACFCLCDYDSNQRLDNLAPGEVKVSFKFRYDFLNAVEEYPKAGIMVSSNKKVTEAEKVFTQIYQYMNDRDALVGYIITDQELIPIRRRGDGYGSIDISSPIPISSDEGKINAKLALWYLIHRYLVSSGPPGGKFLSTVKPVDWKDQVTLIQKRRRESIEAAIESALKNKRTKTQKNPESRAVAKG